jgi:hypothetical protein
MQISHISLDFPVEVCIIKLTSAIVQIQEVLNKCSSI